MQAIFQQWGTLDTFCLVVLLLSMLLGWWRGMVRELGSLLSWLAAFLLARWAAPMVVPWLPSSWPWMADPVFARWTAMLLVFVLALLLIGLFTSGSRNLLRGIGLGGVDQLLGAGFGVVRALVLLWAMTAVVWMTPMHQTTWWKNSVSASMLTETLQSLSPWLPSPMRPWLPAGQGPALSAQLPPGLSLILKG